MDEIARQLAREDPNLLSPMAIRLVRLSANLRPEFARTLETRLIARLVNSTNVKITVCAECTSLRSRVEDGNWMVTMGAVKQEDLRRIGQTTGIKTFMDVDFTYAPNSNVVWMQAMAFRASDGGVVWSDAYRSDATMAALLRTGRRIPTRAERAAELEQKINARPNYGYAASLGVAQIGYNAPTGNIAGAQVSLRFHEKFGEDLGSLFGLSAGIFTTGPPSTTKVPERAELDHARRLLLAQPVAAEPQSPRGLVLHGGRRDVLRQRGEHVLRRERPRHAPQVAAVTAGRAHVRVPDEVRGVRSRWRRLPPARRR